MPIVLLRVDERLIHGQVVVAWGARLHPGLIVVVDDELAGSEWEQELYTLGLPGDMDALFFDVSEGRKRLDKWRHEEARIILLTRDMETMSRVAEGGVLSGEEVNVGGVHDAPGRSPVLPYVFLSRTEIQAIRRLEAEGVRVTARDLPGSESVELSRLVDESTWEQ